MVPNGWNRCSCCGHARTDAERVRFRDNDDPQLGEGRCSKLTTSTARDHLIAPLRPLGSQSAVGGGMHSRSWRSGRDGEPQPLVIGRS